MDLLRKVIKELTPQVIQVNAEVRNWIDAVKLSGELLYQVSKISNTYIKAMIKTTQKLGPYAVIAPGVALPHARPEDGALKVGISVVTLKNPVDFDSPNDPVRIVIAFSAPTNSQHLQLLKELATILGNREFRKKLRRAGSPEDVISTFRWIIQEEVRI
ncbi:PTS sugar transporter subunit IIA [Thermococcus paralvinellae]|uniref:PTS sugar transporter subunit IIA n=1 Tax=Thermococcus paralvinellae TaxID=582419 RepID=UPI0005B28161|nr:PTS sugar transporter subunit IIA [Thermococcus paralvinellae]